MLMQVWVIKKRYQKKIGKVSFNLVCAHASLCIPSGEVMVEESGVPVQDDWSMAPDEEKVKFSLSGVTPHCKTMRAAVRAHITWSYTLKHTKKCVNSHCHRRYLTPWKCIWSVCLMHTYLLLVYNEFVATSLRFTARLLILFRKHRGILGKWPKCKQQSESASDQNNTWRLNILFWSNTER